MIHNITVYPARGLPGSADDTASVAGAVLTHNGTEYDLSSVPDGGDATPAGEHPFVGAITRTGANLYYGLRISYGSTALPDQTRVNWNVAIEDEALPDLIARKPI